MIFFVFTAIFFVAEVVSVLWMVGGFITGMVWLVTNLIHKRKINWKKWIFITWGGMVASLIVLILTVLKQMILLSPKY